MKDIKYDQRNYRKHSEANLSLIKKSLEECGAGRSIVLDKEDVIIAGNGVYEQAQELGLKVRIIESDGKELIAIKRTDLATTDEKRKLLAMADNRTSDTSEFDFDLLREDFDIDILNDFDFDFTDVNIGEDPSFGKSDVGKAGSLSDRFIIPPFSILDSKSGRWQERKNEWLSLGIKSEIGRGENLTFSNSAQPPRIYEIRNKLREKNGANPSWDELIEYCKSKNIALQEGTSIFDPVLCELVYRWFNVPDGIILDPFSGGSVRGIVAAKLGMQYYGVDLRKEQIEANYENAKEVIGEKNVPYWVCEDSLNIKELFYKDKFDLLFSCPPYADLEVYSNDPRDLSNMEYREFVVVYRMIISRACELLNDNRFAVFVVGEVRNKTGIYHNFVADTIDAFRSAGLSYYNEMILATQVGSMAIRVSRQFNSGRKIGKLHQNVLVFYKGDVKQIKTNYPEIDFSEEDFFIEDE